MKRPGYPHYFICIVLRPEPCELQFRSLSSLLFVVAHPQYFPILTSQKQYYSEPVRNSPISKLISSLLVAIVVVEGRNWLKVRSEAVGYCWRWQKS